MRFFTSPSNARLCDTRSSHLQAEVFFDVLGQGVINFVVTWYRLFLTGGRIVVDVVAPAVAKKNAALLFEVAGQFAALHSAISLVL